MLEARTRLDSRLVEVSLAEGMNAIFMNTMIKFIRFSQQRRMGNFARAQRYPSGSLPA